MYLYDDVALSIVSNLNTRILNMSFSKLADNDTSILPVNEYAPKIWENKWFNDNTVAGYAKGDAVWKYTMTLETFLSNYNTLIYDYANENHILNGYFKFGKGLYNKTEEEIARYLNVISGYGEYKQVVDENGDITLSWHLILPPLFDYGAYNKSVNLPIEIYVSLLNNNKELLSNSLAWTNITLSDLSAFKQYISAELSLMIDEHIKHYHLDGVNTSAEFAEILLKRDFSNFDISALYNAQHMTSHSKYINDLGFDYVVEFIKEPTYTTINDTCYELYRWCRLWNSGHLEHGGIVEMPKYTYASSTSVSDYTLSVDLTWPSVDILIYDYPVCADFYGLTANNLYFANDVELRDYSLSNGLKLTNRYSISLTPVQFNGNDIDTTNPSNIKLKSEADISEVTYPTSANLDRNKTFVNFEVHSITNNSFCITRSRTDDLRNNDTIRYVLYYTSGYRTSIVKSYNMLSCVIENLSPFYAYTGNEIEPNIRVYANNGEEMRKDIDYIIRYKNNVELTLNDAIIELEGISPYYGTLALTFGIKYEINVNDYEIVNVLSAYKFQQ